MTLKNPRREKNPTIRKMERLTSLRACEGLSIIFSCKLIYGASLP